MELEVVAVPDPEIEVNEKDKHEMSPRSIDKPLPCHYLKVRTLNLDKILLIILIIKIWPYF